MFCYKCNCKINETDNYCANCGVKVKRGEVTQVSSKKVIAVLSVIIIAIFAITYWENGDKTFKEEGSKNNNIEKIINTEPTEIEKDISQPEYAATEEQMIERTLEYAPKLKEMYDKLYNHYLNLYDEYGDQKVSYDVNSWTVFLNKWNTDLKEYRSELDSYEVTGHVYDLLYAKNQLTAAGTDMAVVWIYYSNLLDNPNDDGAYENLMYFTENIENSFKESKAYLDEY